MAQAESFAREMYYHEMATPEGRARIFSNIPDADHLITPVDVGFQLIDKVASVSQILAATMPFIAWSDSAIRLNDKRGHRLDPHLIVHIPRLRRPKNLHLPIQCLRHLVEVPERSATF